jgi:hypothetical protein
VVEGLTDAQLIERIERIERNLERLAAHMDVELEDPGRGLDPDVIDLARAGDRMGAAKLLVERTGVDFVQAQQVVAEL